MSKKDINGIEVNPSAHFDNIQLATDHIKSKMFNLIVNNKSAFYLKLNPTLKNNFGIQNGVISFTDNKVVQIVNSIIIVE